MAEERGFIQVGVRASFVLPFSIVGNRQKGRGNGTCAIVKCGAWLTAALLALLACLSPVAHTQTAQYIPSKAATGLALQQTTYAGAATTSVSGTVYAPNG